MLQAVAAIAGLAILLWSLGLPSLRFAEAASVTQYSDLLSNSAPGEASNHTITFTTPTGVANGQTIVLDFSDGPFVLGSVAFDDLGIATTGDYTVAADCTGSEHVGADFGSWPTLTLTFCSGDNGLIPANGTTTITIGTNTTGGNAQLTNPAVGSYQIPITVGASDSGETRVAIVDDVVVSASVDTTFTFTISGVAQGIDVNGTTTTGSSSATKIPFGELQAGIASTAAQDLAVTTNARNGFAVTVQVDQQLLSATGADIDGFIEGAFTSSPTPWQAPTPTLGQENTYGHWGITTEDSDSGYNFDPGDYVSPSTTPVEIFGNDGPADGLTTNIGTTTVGYTVQVSALQEAATDYTATLTYVATPVF